MRRIFFLSGQRLFRRCEESRSPLSPAVRWRTRWQCRGGRLPQTDEFRHDFVQRLSPAFAEFRLGFVRHLLHLLDEFRLGFVRHLLHLLDEFRLGFVRPLSPFPAEFRHDFVQRSPLPSTNSDLVSCTHASLFQLISDLVSCRLLSISCRNRNAFPQKLT